jgi:hypothetical protein
MIHVAPLLFSRLVVSPPKTFANLKGVTDERATKFAAGAGVYAAFKRGDVTGALNTLADDVGWFLPGPKDIIPFVGSAPRPSSLGEIRIATS